MKVSIITINRNNAEGLEKTIRSVVSQSYDDYEYIVIDGASDDGSVDIIKRYAGKISYWISEPDTGIYNAMNKGIRQAKGEYLHFLNSGDAYMNNDVLSSVFEGKEYNESILRGIQISDFEIYQSIWGNNRNPLNLYDMYSDTIPHQATFINKTLFEKYGLYDEKYKISSDWKLFLQAVYNNESILFLDIKIVVFDTKGCSLNSDFREFILRERREMLENVIPHTTLMVLDDYDQTLKLKMKTQKMVDYYKQYEEFMYLPQFAAYHPFARFCFRSVTKVFKLFKIKPKF